jgi:Sec7-like guanine-nucleotide exchange factor
VHPQHRFDPPPPPPFSQLGAVKFNTKPKEGIAFLRSAALLPPSGSLDAPVAIAFFLTHCPGVSKRRMGEFIVQDNADCRAVLLAVMASCDIAGAPFDVALRRILCAFRLPGEAQQIDRVMQAFGATFVAANPGVFSGGADVA